VIPEPQHPEALPAKPRIALEVRRRCGMLPAISLDDEPTAEVHEIDDKRPQRLLAPELLPHEPVRAQATPQTTLAVRHVLAKMPGERRLVHRNSPVP
jgi:hypothetical protein